MISASQSPLGTTWKLEQRDILDWVKEYDGPKAMALFCDPPYHLTSITKRFGKPGSTPAKGDVYARASKGFMGQEWDGGGIAFNPELWAALGEHLYPGAFGLAFASPRNQHRMACAIEDAGFIIQPTIYGYCYLSGFPKATRIDTQLDKAAGNTRHDKLKGGHIGMGKAAGDGDNENELQNRVPHIVGKGNYTNGSPVDPLAQAWAGHRYGGQALKPMIEPLICFQKPYEGRPLDSIVATGAGALNIDGGRIGTRADAPQKGQAKKGSVAYGHINVPAGKIYTDGRWPGNLYLHHHPACNGQCVPDCPVRLFDEQGGNHTGGSPKTGNEPSELTKNTYGKRNRVAFAGYEDDGPASRMLFRGDWSYEIAEQLAAAEALRYEPKASVAEREAGLDELPARMRHRVNSGGLENEPRFAPKEAKNHHPTVKSISVCKYWATLLLPPAEYAPRRILIPFSGVASEMIGAMLAGFEEVIGIEQSAEYAEIARARLRWWSQWPGWGQTDVDAILAAAKVDDVGQLSLFPQGGLAKPCDEAA